MKFLSRWFGQKQKNTTPKTVRATLKAQKRKKPGDKFQAFILEPILTPSALVDIGGEEAIDPSLLTGDDLPWLDALNGNGIENATPSDLFTSGTFTVGASGEVSIDFLFDGGSYQGELAIFSLEGMENYEPGSPEFITEAASRALSDTEWGHVVITDKTEGARFTGNLGEGNFNHGEYQGTKTVEMRAGDQFGIILIPNGEIEEILNNPEIGGAKTPLFSLSTANPNDGLHWGQIADLTGDGQTFVMEDVRLDSNWYDKDYNDIILQIRGATGEAPDLEEVIADQQDWRETDLGQEILEFANSETDLIPPENIIEIEIASPQPHLSEIALEGIEQAIDSLEEFSQQPDFLEKIQLTFGTEIEIENATAALDNLITGENIPRIEILNEAELGNANAAYSSETQTIYLSQTFLENHSQTPQLISNLLLEELGHHLDSQLNSQDTPGDEGAIFAQLVREADLTNPQLIALQQENDSITLNLNGQQISLEQNSTGLRGEYYNREDFGDPKIVRTDPNLNFLWGLGTSAWGDVGADRFSIRWTGWLEAPESETYNFTLEANGRSRIWLQNPTTGEWHKLLDTWNQGDPNTTTSHTVTPPFPLQQNTHYPIKIEYQDDIGEANLNLKWENPSRPLETIPSSYLHPGFLPLPNTAQNGTGLKVKHYHDPDFGQLRHEQNENGQLHYDWGEGVTVWHGTPPDGHSSTWTGRIEAPTTETYEFSTRADGRTRVWIKDQQETWHKIVEGWDEDTGGIRTHSGTVPFTFNTGQQYEIKVEYQDDTGNSSIELLWESPSRSPEVIPAAFLHPSELSEEPGVQSQGTGLKVKHYHDPDFGQLRQEQNENGQLNHDWGEGVTVWHGTPPDGHSSTWTGRIEAPANQTYEFSTRADGRSRVWLKDEYGTWHKIVEGWDEDTGGTRERSGTIPFEFIAGNQYEIKVEYQDDTGNSNIELLWQSPEQTQQVIPPRYLYPTELSEEPGVQAQGTGLKVKHYHDPDFGQLRHEQNENGQLNHDWGEGVTVWHGTPPDGHSSTWTGRIEAPANQTYEFSTRADGRSRVWLKDEYGTWHKIIEGWDEDTGGTRERSGTIPFEFIAGNQYEIKVEYQDDTGNSNIELLWQSPEQTQQVIPPRYLYPTELSEEPGVQAQGTGVKAEYFIHKDFSHKRISNHQEPEINQDWGSSSPSHFDIPHDGWSGIWTGKIEAPTTDLYNFSTRADGKVKFWLRQPGGEWQELIDAWDEDPNTAEINTSPGVFLEAGIKYDFKAEFTEEIGNADLEILWENSTRTREVIPTKYLYPIAPEYPAGVSAQGTGLNGLAFNGTDPSGASNLGIPQQRIDFEWAGGNAAYGSLPNDNWSARFSGKLEAPYSEDFTLVSRADGGSRVWVRDPNTNTWHQVIDNWTDSNSSVDTSGVIPFSLEAGVKYDFQVEYKDEVGEAQMKLLWESDSQSLSVIPQEFLYPEQLTIPVGVEGKGEGLKGEYFNNADLTDAVLSRTDAGVNFAWGTDSPDAGIDPDTYSARWTGQIEPLYDEDYTFYTQSDDGVRLWVNGELLIDNWDNGNEERASVPISLQGGEKYDIKMEYFEETGLASAKLLWSSLSQNKEVIPSSQLYPPREPILGVTWTGTIEAEYDEVYTFDLNAAEPARVWVDGQLIIDGTNLPLGGNVAQSGSLLLSAGHSYEVELEYVDNDEEAEGGWISLDWGSPSQATESVLSVESPWFHYHVADSSSGSGSVDFETSGVDTSIYIDQKREPQGLFFEGNSGYFEIPFAAPMGDEVQVLVDIDIEGPLAEFMEKTGDLDWVNQSFILESGDGDKLLAGMLKAIDISGLDKDVLYGSVINIRESRYSYSGDPDPEYSSEYHSKHHRINTSYELYRWLDVVGAKENLGAGVTVGLHEKEENELGEFTKTKEFDYFLPESKGITLAGRNENIDYTQTASGIAGTGTAKWEVSELPIAFTPEEGGDFVGGNGNFVEDTVMLTAAGLELSLDVKGRVSIGDRVKELERKRMEDFKNRELTQEEIDNMESMEEMQQRLYDADNSVGMAMKSALVYITPREQDGVEGVEVIMVPGDPNQEPIHRFKAVSHAEFEDNLIDTRRNVTNERQPTAYQDPRNPLYENTIRLIYEELESLGINHLQLVVDDLPNRSQLQATAWAALYDTRKGQHLIEQFSLAISPSFQMTQLQHHDMRNAERFVLAETEFLGEDALPDVLPEFNLVNQSNVTKIPEDQKFNQVNLENTINRIGDGNQILHVATHGDFTNDSNLWNDYISAAEGGEGNVTLGEFAQYDFSDLELAVLSACRTALGNTAYEYGFSGIAWGEGAESAIGALWYVNDKGTAALMHAFYHELSTYDIPLAKIQQEVLRAMIEGRIYFEGGASSRIVYQSASQGEISFSIPSGFDRDYIHPYFWSAFPIIGSGH